MSLQDQIAPFLIGGISGALATLFIQPIDGFKVLIQLVSEKRGIEGNASKRIHFGQLFRDIYKSEGFSALYRGLDSAILRQLVYASVRLGAYNFMLDSCKNRDIPINNGSRIFLSMVSGIMGALVGTPFDVALIRRQASLLHKKVYYRNTAHAFYRIVKDEGVLTLWKGLNITILRVVMINIGQLASYDIIKEQLQKVNYLREHTKLESASSALLASFLTSFISMPADNIKVKIQKSLKGDNTYTGIVDCLIKTLRREGFSKFWVGFPIYLVRGAPHSFILITTQEYLRDLYKTIAH